MLDLQILKQLPRETVWEDVASRLGLLTVLASDNGVHAIAFESDQTEQAKTNLPRAENHPIINAVDEQLAMYFDGTLKVFDLLLDLRGTDFQKRVSHRPCIGQLSAGDTLWRDADLWRHRPCIGQCGRLASRGRGQWQKSRGDSGTLSPRNRRIRSSNGICWGDGQEKIPA